MRSLPFIPVGKRLRRWLIAAVIVIGLYALLGFFAAPPLIKHELTQQLQKQTGQQVSIGKVAFNPFALSITIRQVALNQWNNAALAGFGRLYVNFDPFASIWHRAWTFGEIQLDQPELNVVIQPGGALNLASLAGPPATAAPKKSGSGIPSLFIEHLGITQGRVDYADDSRAKPFAASVGDINLKLDDFSTRPGSQSPYALVANLAGGTQIGWRGKFGMQPLMSEGHIDITQFQVHELWRYLQARLRFEIPRGTADVHLDYTLTASGAAPNLQLKSGQLILNNLVLHDPQHNEDAVVIPSLSVDGIALDTARYQLHVGSINTQAGSIEAALLPHDQISLASLLTPIAESPANVDKPSADPPPWQVAVDEVAVSDFRIRARDETIAPGTTFNIYPVNLTVQGYRTGSNVALGVNADLGLGKGRVATKGQVILAPLKVDLDVTMTDFPLQSVNPYIRPYANLALTRGTLGINSNIIYDGAGAKPSIRASGDVRVYNLVAADTTLHMDFVRWRELHLSQIHYVSTPAALSIREIIAAEPYARVIIAPDHSSNVGDIFKTTKTNNTAGAKPSSGSAGRPMLIRVGEISIRNGSANFADLSIKPGFRTGIQALNGTIKGLSSRELGRANVNIRGSVDKYAPVTIQGQINPLTTDAFTDITMTFHGIELTTLTPYSGKFAGYKIDKGKLDMTLHYKLNKKLLVADNKIILDQLTLGAPVNSPDAVSLPIRLAIALLKDSRGVIDIDLPITGDLNNPDFHYGAIIWMAVKHLVVNIVTAPFKFLGSLFGGSKQELNLVAFSPGSSTLDQAQQKKLGNLAKALRDRPQLILEIRGAVAVDADKRALAGQVLNERLDKVNPAATDEQKSGMLLAMYKQAFHKDPALLLPPVDPKAPPQPAAEREQAMVSAARESLLASIPISDGQLYKLAQARADAIKSYLETQGTVPDAQLYLLAVDLAAKEDKNAVNAALNLKAK